MNASRPDVGSSAKSSGGFVNTLEEKRNEGEACIQWALWCAITKSLAKLFLNEATCEIHNKAKNLISNPNQ